MVVFCFILILLLAGVDYDNTTLTATFTNGSNITTVEIPIINDTIVEKNEVFNVTINLPKTTGVRVMVGDRSTATAVIIDSSMLIYVAA